MKYLFCILTVFVFSVGCNSPDPAHQIISQLLKTDKGLFRGADFGMSMDAVKTLEGPAAEEPDEHSLLYIYEKKDSLFSYRVAYSFNKGLEEINTDIDIRNELTAVDVYNQLKLHFTKRYGEPISEKGFYTWTAEAGNQTTATISMTGDMPSGENPRISLAFYNAAL